MRQTMATAVFSTIQRRCSVWGLRFGRTIRGRILIALLVMSMITAALGVHAAIGISGVGALVSKTFDGSLMSINYARAAAADFASMQAAFARRWVVSDSEMRAKLDESVDSWARSLTDDLEIAAQRSQSKRAARAAANVQLAVKNWNTVRLRLIEGTEPNVNWGTLDPTRRSSTNRSTCWSITPRAMVSSTARLPARRSLGKCISIWPARYSH